MPGRLACPDVEIFALAAQAHVADVRRSVEVYELLGLSPRDSHHEDGRLVWAFVTSPWDEPNAAGARLMLALADEPVDPARQAVLSTCWTPDVHGLREELVRTGVEVGEVTHPFHMPAGELRVVDPDGYVLLIGQFGAPEG